jgi:hypothetical protein
MLDEMVAAAVPKAKPQKPVKDAYRCAGGHEDGGYRYNTQLRESDGLQNGV